MNTISWPLLAVMPSKCLLNKVSFVTCLRTNPQKVKQIYWTGFKSVRNDRAAKPRKHLYDSQENKSRDQFKALRKQFYDHFCTSCNPSVYCTEYLFETWLRTSPETIKQIHWTSFKSVQNDRAAKPRKHLYDSQKNKK